MLNIQLSDFLDKISKEFQASKQIAISQAWGILQLAISETIQAIEQNYPQLKGASKKTIALELLNSFYDRVFLVIDIPYVPKPLQPIIQRYVKLFLMAMVSTAIDAMVTTFRKTGVFVDPKTTVDPNIDNKVQVSDK